MKAKNHRFLYCCGESNIWVCSNEKRAQTKAALYNVVMLTKPRFLLSLSKKIGFFYNSENNDNDDNDKDYSHNHANNHNNYDIIKWNLEMVNQQRTLCVPKKEKTRWFSLYLCFLLQISREFHFSLCFVFFLSVAVRFYIHTYIHIYIYIYIIHIYVCMYIVQIIYTTRP